ncbi:MAG: 2Fe-2S iron-sulfur cluster-binding protein [Gammaproteobacteria bacterium]|nr:2Fe-2S iron-sulfur cluster-binding protein [Gammaproteobacteria bacterium]
MVFQPSGRRGRIPEGRTILKTARKLGVGIEDLCAGARTCAKCRVRVEEGMFDREDISSSLCSGCSLPERNPPFFELLLYKLIDI